MRCSEFRDLHCAYVDDTLAGVELVRMQRHVAECLECASLDTRVRRSLMLVRSLPPIEPSSDFARRLDARLEECRSAKRVGSYGASFRAVASVGAVASVAMIVYLAQALSVAPLGQRGAGEVAPSRIDAASMASAVPASVVVPSVVAVPRVDSAVSDTTPAPAIVASVAVGVPIWPVALLAEQGTVHFATYSGVR